MSSACCCSIRPRFSSRRREYHALQENKKKRACTRERHFCKFIGITQHPGFDYTIQSKEDMNLLLCGFFRGAKKVCQATKLGKVFVHLLCYSIATVSYVVPQVVAFMRKIVKVGILSNPTSQKLLACTRASKLAISSKAAILPKVASQYTTPPTTELRRFNQPASRRARQLRHSLRPSH